MKKKVVGLEELLQVEVYGSRGGGRKWSWEGIEEFLREIVEQAKQKGVREVPVPLAYFAEYYNGGNFEEFASSPRAATKLKNLIENRAFVKELGVRIGASDKGVWKLSNGKEGRGLIILKL